MFETYIELSEWILRLYRRGPRASGRKGRESPWRKQCGRKWWKCLLKVSQSSHPRPFMGTSQLWISLPRQISPDWAQGPKESWEKPILVASNSNQQHQGRDAHCVWGFSMGRCLMVKLCSIRYHSDVVGQFGGQTRIGRDFRTNWKEIRAEAGPGQKRSSRACSLLRCGNEI